MGAALLFDASKNQPFRQDANGTKVLEQFVTIAPMQLDAFGHLFSVKIHYWCLPACGAPPPPPAKDKPRVCPGYAQDPRIIITGTTGFWNLRNVSAPGTTGFWEFWNVSAPGTTGFWDLGNFSAPGITGFWDFGECLSRPRRAKYLGSS